MLDTGQALTTGRADRFDDGYAVGSVTLPATSHCTTEASIRTNHSLVELRHYRWLEPQEAVFTPTHSFFEFLLSERTSHAEGMYTDLPRAEMRRFGRTSFVPASFHLSSRWQASDQHSVSCALDIGAIAGRQIEWDRKRLLASLDLRSAPIYAAANRLAAEIMNPGFASSMMIEALGIAMGIEIFRFFDSSFRLAEPRVGRLNASQMDDLRDILLDAHSRPNLNALARERGVSVRHLSRLFRAATGESMSAFITRQRIERAKTLLADRSLSIKEIAFRSGFLNPAAFTAAFRRETGITPTQFRCEVNGAEPGGAPC